VAHTYISSIFHVVFSTKERMPLIRAEIQPRLWSYTSAIARNHRIHVLAIGRTSNHVHVLLVLPADQKLADVVRTLKCNSSRWMREGDRRFGWQEGYGAFSVSPSQLLNVERYIARQAEHHRKRSFEDEFRAMLQAANIKIDQTQTSRECRP
jgi:REP element-mobilizing transposase RayT